MRNRFPAIEALDEEQLEFIHDVSLRIVEEEGIDPDFFADGKQLAWPEIAETEPNDRAEILERLEKKKNAEDSASSLPDVLRKRAKLIMEIAQFRHDDDAVPVPGTVTTIFAIDGNGVVERQHGNILGNNYFGIAKVLSR